MLVSIVVTVVAVVVAVVVPSFRQLRERGTVDAAEATMQRLEQRISDLSRTGPPRGARAEVEIPGGRLDALRDRTCWAVTASSTGPERLDFTLDGVGDGDGAYGLAIHGSEGLDADGDDPVDLVVEATRWEGNQRRVHGDSRPFEVRSTRHLVLGGSGALDNLDGIVAYDADDDAAEARSATLPTARAGAAAVWAAERRVAYLFGGSDGGDEIVAYAPHNDTAWVAGRLPEAVRSAAAVWVPERGAAYVLGGRTVGGATDAIVAYTPANGTAWTRARLPAPRHAAGAVWDPVRDRAYLLGGRATVGGADLATITAFAPANGSAWDRASLPVPRAEAGAAWDPVREVAYLFGGAGPEETILAWEPATGEATTRSATLPSARASTSATWDPDQEVAYVFGGVGSLGEPTDAIVAYDPVAGTAEATSATLPTPRNATAAAAADAGNGSLSLPGGVALCDGRVRLRVLEAASRNLTGEAWIAASGSLRWQMAADGGLHAVEILHGARVVETPRGTTRLSGFDAVRTRPDAVEVDVVRLAVPEGVAATVGQGPATVPLRGEGAFAVVDARRANVTLAFHGAWNGTFRDAVQDATTFAPGPGGVLREPGPVALVAVDRPVALPDGLVAR